MIRTYGWRPDKPDARDFRFAAPRRRPGAKLPPMVDLRPKCPPVLDQGDLGACTAFASGNAYVFAHVAQGMPAFPPAPLFQYYNTRILIGTVNYDSGAEIRDAIKALNQYGICGEPLWPYLPGKFKAEPTRPAYDDGEKHQAVQYERVDGTLAGIKACLAAGRPIVFGFTVYESFESKRVERTGTMPMPKKKERVLGGHAVLAVGYSDKTKKLTVMNSWGTKWGKQGFFAMPYAFAADSNFCDDWWTLEVVE